jgi:RNA polymerase sigma-70 factor (ECF subfamily)
VDVSDETLMLRAGRGDGTACQLLVERHLGAIVTFAHRTLGDRSEADDAAQEVFLRVWSASARWRRQSARFRTWLYRVALNVCLDRLAKARRTPSGEPAEHAVLVADRTLEPFAATHAAEVGRHVSVALAELPDAQRIAVTLCYYQGLRNVEAADVMGVSVEALESLLARGRRALRERLRAIAPALMGAG